MKKIVKAKDIIFDKDLFVNYLSGTVLDLLLCSYRGLPKGVNYMVIGDPGVGKTTIILDLMANIHRIQPNVRMLFVSAEMNEIDLAIYVQRYPKFGELDIMFVEAEFDSEAHALDDFEEALRMGWDIVAIDSFYELQGIVKEEENITLKKSESLLLSIIKKQNKAKNERGVHTSFLTIQQVTKTGAFIGSNRLKHMITAMMELRLDNPKNVYSDRYVTFSKHRRGDVGVKLYYSLIYPLLRDSNEINFKINDSEINIPEDRFYVRKQNRNGKEYTINVESTLKWEDCRDENGDYYIFFSGFRHDITKEINRKTFSTKGQMVTNLLRSEHIPYNIFFPMIYDKKGTACLFNKIIGDGRIAEVNEIVIEYNPGGLKDGTSFDVYIEYTAAKHGGKGGIGIEVKYTEKEYPIKRGSKEWQETHNAIGIHLADNYRLPSEHCGWFKEEFIADVPLAANSLKFASPSEC